MIDNEQILIELIVNLQSISEDKKTAVSGIYPWGGKEIDIKTPNGVEDIKWLLKSYLDMFERLEKKAKLQESLGNLMCPKCEFPLILYPMQNVFMNECQKCGYGEWVNVDNATFKKPRKYQK